MTDKTIDGEFFKEPSKNSVTRDIADIVGWILSVILPLSIYLFTPPIEIDGFGNEPKLFLCVLSSAGVMWTFSLLPEFIPGIFVLLSTLLLSLVDSPVVLSGFSSPTFTTVLSIIAMTMVIIDSGVMKRFLLYLLRHVHSPCLAGWVLFGFGSLITPILPSIISRAQLLGPLVKDISKPFESEKDPQNRTFLFANGFYGLSLLSSSFLSASLLNFIVLSLLPLQEQEQFQSQGWFKGALVITVVLLFFYFLILPIFFGTGKKSQKTGKTLTFSNDQTKRIQAKEVVSLGVLLTFFVGTLTSNYHRIPSSWLAFLAFFLLLVFGFIQIDDFRKKIDWPYLFFLSSIVGISSTFKTMGLDLWLYNNFLTFIPEILNDKLTLFGAITAVTLILRLVLPVGAVVTLLIPTALAIATKVGVSGWSVSIVLLFVADIWFFPYQCTFYQIYRSDFEGSGISEKRFLLSNAALSLVKILALFLSIYYWKYLSLI